MRRIKSDSRPAENTQGRHYTPNPVRKDSQLLDSIQAPRQNDSPIGGHFAQVGLETRCRRRSRAAGPRAGRYAFPPTTTLPRPGSFSPPPRPSSFSAGSVLQGEGFGTGKDPHSPRAFRRAEVRACLNISRAPRSRGHRGHQAPTGPRFANQWPLLVAVVLPRAWLGGFLLVSGGSDRRPSYPPLDLLLRLDAPNSTHCPRSPLSSATYQPADMLSGPGVSPGPKLSSPSAASSAPRRQRSV
jgi:hypothetical protein